MRVTSIIFLLFVAAIASGCHPRPKKLVFSSAFGMISLSNGRLVSEAIDVPGRDHLVYGRVEGSSSDIAVFLEENRAEVSDDDERAKLRYSEIKEIAKTVGGFPTGWLSSSESPRQLGRIGKIDVVVCSNHEDSTVVYLVDN